MNKWLLGILLSFALVTLASAWPQFGQRSVSSASTDAVFTPTATYYMSPSGSDGANGLTRATAWATPNHAVNCGDVIIAAAGTYNGNLNQWGTVSNCPSTTGGIDGAGGILAAVLLCGGSDLGTAGCIVDCATAACASGVLGSGGSNSVSACMNVNKSYWSIQGWQCKGNGATHRGFQLDACLTTSTIIHHVSFINDVVTNAAQGANTNACGYGGATNGGDYFAVVGVIAQNAAQDTICLAAIDAVGVAQLDSGAGTHIFFHNDFSYAHANAACTAVSDTQAYMFDTLDARGVNYQLVLSNSMGWRADRSCVQLFWQNLSSAAPTVKVNNMTCFENDVSTGSDFLDSEIMLQPLTSNFPWNVYFQNNIAYQPLATSVGGSAVAAQTLGGGPYTGAFVNEGNLLRANRPSCSAPNCNSTFDAQSFNTAAQLNVTGNTYANPAFVNTADLLANWVSAPNCTGYENTTQCMGWDAYTSTLRAGTPIADLTPSTTYSAKGFQRASTTCAANADFPTWLKGLIYLHVNGATILQRHGLATTPCGL